MTKLEQNANHLATWFPENYMKLNEGKWVNVTLLFLGLARKMLIWQGEESDDEKLLGVILDMKLSFKKQVQKLCKI